MTDSTDAHETPISPDRVEARGVPFGAICRAKALSGNVEIAACLVREPQYCPYAWRYGWDWICTHPRRREIVARTQEEPPVSIPPSILTK